MIRLTTIPPPLNDFTKKCIDWGSCGICAIAAKNSVLLYITDMSNYTISFLRVVEFSACNIYALKFHHDKPLLAISRDSGLVIYNCQEGKTKSGLTGEIPVMRQIEWSGDTIIGFSAPNILLAIKFQQMEDLSDSSSGQIEVTSPSKSNSSRCQIIWKYEMKGEFKGISIDPFSHFRILAYSNNNSISIYQSENSYTAPHFILSNTLSSPILDAQFHPLISDIIFILTNNSTIMSFEIQTQSTFYIIQEPNSLVRFEQLIFPYHTFHEFFIICSDSSIISYETTDNVLFSKRYWGSQVVRSLRTVPQSFADSKRNQLQEKCFLLSNFLFDDTFIFYSKSAGLSLMKSSDLLEISNNDNKTDYSEFIVSLNNNTPHNITAFDSYRNNVGYGTAEGDIYIVDSIKARVKFHFNFGDQVVKFLFINTRSFLWLSIPKKSSQSPNLIPTSSSTSSLESGSDHMNSQLMLHAGYFNIMTRKLVRFKNVTDIYSNRKYGIIQHGGFYFEIISHSDAQSQIHKLYMPKEISAIALQIEEEIQLRSSSSFHNLKKKQDEATVNRHRSVTAIHKNKFNFTDKIPQKYLDSSSSICDGASYEEIRKLLEEEEEIDTPNASRTYLNEPETQSLSQPSDNITLSDLLQNSSVESNELPKFGGNKVQTDESDDSDTESESRCLNNSVVCKEGCLLALITSDDQNIVTYDIQLGKYTRKLQCPREFIKSKIVALSFTHNLIVLIDIESRMCLVNLKQSSSQLISSIHFNGIRKMSFQKTGTKFFVLTNDKRLVVFDNLKNQNSNPIHNTIICNHYVSDFSTCHNNMLFVQSTRSELKFITDDKMQPIKQAVSIEKTKLPAKASRLRSIAKLIKPDLNSSEIGYIFACHSCQLESLIWKVVDAFFNSLDPIKEKNRKPLPLKFYQYGGSKEYHNLMEFRCSLIQSSPSNSEAAMYQLLTAMRCHNIEKMREAILHSMQNVYGVIAASMIDAKLSETGISFVEQTAMEYFDQGRNLEATILMELIDNKLSAAMVLQSKNRWGASVEILLEMKHKEEARNLIKTAAFHYLQIGDMHRALLLFISIGEFYPALLLMMDAKMYVASYFLLKYVDNKTELKTFPNIYKSLFGRFQTIDELKQTINEQFEEFINV